MKNCNFSRSGFDIVDNGAGLLYNNIVAGQNLLRIFKLYDIYQMICFRSTELEGEKLWRSSAWKENNTPEGSSPRAIRRRAIMTSALAKAASV